MKFAEKLKIILQYPGVIEDRRILKAMAYINKCYPNTTALEMSHSGDSIVFNLNSRKEGYYYRVQNIRLRPTSYYSVLEESSSINLY